MTAAPAERPGSSHKRLLCAAAAHQSWANTEDRTARTLPGTQGLLARFEREVDPAGSLDPQVRRERAEQLRRAHMLRLSAKAVAARAARREARNQT